MAVDTEGPDPSHVETSEEYVAALRALKAWSKLTYRQLSTRAEAAGYVLPHSTLAGSLSRATLPRRDVVTALVRACGCDDEAMAVWMSAYDRTAAREKGGQSVAAVPSDPEETAVGTGGRTGEAGAAGGVDTGGGETRPLRRPSSRPRWWGVVAFGLLVAAGAGLFIALAPEDGEDRRPPAASSDRPPVGEVRIRAAHTGMCVTEGRERNQRTDRPLAVQRDCGAVENSPPKTMVEALGSGVYQIVWVHPEHGTGCLQVDDGGLEDGRLVSPHDCDTTAPHQRFLFEPVDGSDPRRFRMRPAHSGKCLGFVDPMTEEGAELVQTTCVGSTDQEFVVEPA